MAAPSQSLVSLSEVPIVINLKIVAVYVFRLIIPSG